jgi:hypothetical protein
VWCEAIRESREDKIVSDPLERSRPPAYRDSGRWIRPWPCGAIHRARTGVPRLSTTTPTDTILRRRATQPKLGFGVSKLQQRLPPPWVVAAAIEPTPPRAPPAEAVGQPQLAQQTQRNRPGLSSAPAFRRRVLQPTSRLSQLPRLPEPTTSLHAAFPPPPAPFPGASLPSPSDPHGRANTSPRSKLLSQLVGVGFLPGAPLQTFHPSHLTRDHPPTDHPATDRTLRWTPLSLGDSEEVVTAGPDLLQPPQSREIGPSHLPPLHT